MKDDKKLPFVVLNDDPTWGHDEKTNPKDQEAKDGNGNLVGIIHVPLPEEEKITGPKIFITVVVTCILAILIALTIKTIMLIF